MRHPFLDRVEHLLMMRKHQQLPVTCDEVEDVVARSRSFCSSGVVKVFEKSSSTVHALGNNISDIRNWMGAELSDFYRELLNECVRVLHIFFTLDRSGIQNNHESGFRRKLRHDVTLQTSACKQDGTMRY